MEEALTTKELIAKARDVLAAHVESAGSSKRQVARELDVSASAVRKATDPDGERPSSYVRLAAKIIRHCASGNVEGPYYFVNGL